MNLNVHYVGSAGSVYTTQYNIVTNAVQYQNTNVHYQTSNTAYSSQPYSNTVQYQVRSKIVKNHGHIKLPTLFFCPFLSL